MKTVFTSLDGQSANQSLILEAMADTAALAKKHHTVLVQIMCFAFTDPVIRDRLLKLMDDAPNLQVQLIADWSQRSHASASVVPNLARFAPKGLSVKFKVDFPYKLSHDGVTPTWDYLASLGMLHHKTFCAIADGQAEILTFGSFNWSARGAVAYENTILLTRNKQTADVMDRFVDEFDGLWNDPCVTSEPVRAADLARQARSMLHKGVNLKDKTAISELLAEKLRDDVPRSKAEVIGGSIIASFAAKHPLEPGPRRGMGTRNGIQKIDLLRPNGKRRPAPLTLNTLALEAIRSVPDGDDLWIAMYAMSPRVPEFNAVLQAAQRGCKVRLILDQKIGGGFAKEIASRAHVDGLPIEVKSTHRRMHQKYIVAPKQALVAVGTANMTHDATARHFENRILFNGISNIAERFSSDFEAIWKRIL